LNLLPAFILRRIEGRPNLVRIIDNMSWLFFDKALRMGVGLFVGVWIARYLGPEQYGLLNYAMAFVALFGAFSTLGLQGIVVRDLVKEPEDTNSTLGTAFILQLAGAAVTVALIVVAIGWMRPDDDLTKLMVAILGAALIFRSSAVVKYWFESQVQSRYVVWVENGIFLFMAAIKIGLILSKASLIAFVWVVLVEAIIVAIGLFAIYIRRTKALYQWSASLSRAKNLLRDSWPLILSGIAVAIYMRIDQIMLGEMIGPEAVGVYSAALRISEVWNMVPMVIVASLFPTIIETKKNNQALYIKRIQQLFNLMVVISFSIALVITMSGDWLINFLFGQRYTEAASVLVIHIWTGLFVFLGVASGRWYILEGLQRLAFYRTALGAIVNIIMNIFLIPKYGVVGAAWATVMANASAAYIFDLSNPKTRVMFYMKSRSFNIFKSLSGLRN